MATPYDNRKRTFQFAVRVVSLVRSLPRTLEARELGRQLLRSGTSVGANVEEADGAESKRDFVHKMSIARKEARETCYWLRLLQVTGQEKEESEALLGEADQLVRILTAIIRNAKKKKDKTQEELPRRHTPIPNRRSEPTLQNLAFRHWSFVIGHSSFVM
jgi:four helix bundle protein